MYTYAEDPIAETLSSSYVIHTGIHERRIGPGYVTAVAPQDESIASGSDAVEQPLEKSNPVGNRWSITMTEYEREMLAKIVMLEAGGESDLGQQAVVEVIFNRVIDPSFKNDIIGVLSEKGQFTTWKYVNRGKPTERVYQNIDLVASGQTNIFPAQTVFFSRGAQNKRIQARIGGHVFCNRK